MSSKSKPGGDSTPSCNPLGSSDCFNSTAVNLNSSQSTSFSSVKATGTLSSSTSSMSSISNTTNPLTRVFVFAPQTTTVIQSSPSNSSIGLTSSNVVFKTITSTAATALASSSEIFSLETSTSKSLASAAGSVSASLPTSASTVISSTTAPIILTTISTVNSTGFKFTTASTASSPAAVTTISSYAILGTTSNSELSSSTSQQAPLTALLLPQPQTSSATLSLTVPTTNKPEPTNVTLPSTSVGQQSPKLVIIASATTFAAIAALVLIFGFCLQSRRRRTKIQSSTEAEEAPVNSEMYQERPAWPSQLSHPPALEAGTTPQLPHIASDATFTEEFSHNFHYSVDHRAQSPPLIPLPTVISPPLRGSKTLPPGTERMLHGCGVANLQQSSLPSMDAATRFRPPVPFTSSPGPLPSHQNGLQQHNSHHPSQYTPQPLRSPTPTNNGLAIPHNNNNNNNLFPGGERQQGPTSSSTLIATTFLTVPPHYRPYSPTTSSGTTDSWYSGRPRSNPFDLEDI